MKIHILSDLHLESNSSFKAPKTTADLVVLAGDIGTGTRGVEWANRTFDVHVLYVLGNHEYYGHAFDRLVERCRASAAEHVHVLERTSIELGGVRFLGTTLWTDFLLYGPGARHEAMAQSAVLMNDYRRIKVARQGYRRLAPGDTLRAHDEARAWLATALEASALDRTVVVSHHAPHRGSLAERFAADLVSAAYVSDRSECLGGVPLWIHGHTHDSFDYQVGKTRVLCNPLGYGFERNSGFRPDCVIELPDRGFA